MDTTTRQRALVIVMTIATVLTMPSLAFATGDPPVDPAGPIDAGDTIASIRVSAQLVTLLAGAVIPLLVGLLTKLSSRHKGALMILMNVANSLITTATLSDGTAVFSQQMIVNIVPGVVGSLMAYYGLYKPAGITSSAVALPSATVKGGTTMVPGKLSNVGVHDGTGNHRDAGESTVVVVVCVLAAIALLIWIVRN